VPGATSHCPRQAPVMPLVLVFTDVDTPVVHCQRNIQVYHFVYLRKTSEVDYSSMSLKVVYALQGIECDADDDLYDIGLDNWLGGDDPRRKLIKVFVNALMNDETGNYKLKKAELRTLGLTHKELLALVLKTYEPIADQLTAGIGMKATYLDSQIAELVIKTMQTDDIVVLPIQDSFIERRY